MCPVLSRNWRSLASGLHAVALLARACCPPAQIVRNFGRPVPAIRFLAVSPLPMPRQLATLRCPANLNQPAQQDMKTHQSGTVVTLRIPAGRDGAPDAAGVRIVRRVRQLQQLVLALQQQHRRCLHNVTLGSSASVPPCGVWSYLCIAQRQYDTSKCGHGATKDWLMQTHHQLSGVLLRHAAASHGDVGAPPGGAGAPVSPGSATGWPPRPGTRRRTSPPAAASAAHTSGRQQVCTSGVSPSSVAHALAGLAQPGTHHILPAAAALHHCQSMTY